MREVFIHLHTQESCHKCNTMINEGDTAWVTLSTIVTCDHCHQTERGIHKPTLVRLVAI